MAKTMIKAETSTGVGAGVLFVARSTGRVLFVKRSSRCDEPNTWCCLGGGVEYGETIEQGLRREVFEEGGYSGIYKLIPFAVARSNGFVYHNFFSFVNEEFVPVLNHEHTDFRWAAHKMPSPMHPKLKAALLNYYARKK
jgi:8-oxo-dGTP pyrophosphatase MutT (NUDIX family)